MEVLTPENLEELIKLFYSSTVNQSELNEELVKCLNNPNFQPTAVHLLLNSTDAHVLFFSLNYLLNFTKTFFLSLTDEEKEGLLNSLVSFFHRLLQNPSILTDSIETVVLRKFAKLISIMISLVLPFNFTFILERFIAPKTDILTDHQIFTSNVLLCIILEEFSHSNPHHSTRLLFFKHEISSKIELIYNLVKSFSDFIDSSILTDIASYISQELPRQDDLVKIYTRIVDSYIGILSKKSQYNLKNVNATCEIINVLIKILDLESLYFEKIYSILFYFLLLSSISVHINTDLSLQSSLLNTKKMTHLIYSSLQEIMSKTHGLRPTSNIKFHMNFSYLAMANSFLFHKDNGSFLKEILMKMSLANRIVHEQPVELVNQTKRSFINTLDVVLSNRIFIHEIEERRMEQFLLQLLDFVNSQYETRNLPYYLYSLSILSNHLNLLSRHSKENGSRQQLEAFVTAVIKSVLCQLTFTNESLMRQLKIQFDDDLEEDTDVIEVIEDSLTFQRFIHTVICNLEKLVDYKSSMETVFVILYERINANQSNITPTSHGLHLELVSDLRLFTSLILPNRGDVITPKHIIWMTELLIALLNLIMTWIHEGHGMSLTHEILFSQIISTSCIINTADYVLVLREEELIIENLASDKVLHLSSANGNALIDSYLSKAGHLIVYAQLSDNMQSSCAKLFQHFMRNSSCNNAGLLPSSKWILNAEARGQDRMVDIFLSIIEIVSNYDRITKLSSKNVQASLVTSVICYLLTSEAKVKSKEDSLLVDGKIVLLEELINRLIVSNLNYNTCSPDKMILVIDLLASCLSSLSAAPHSSRERILKVLEKSGLFDRLSTNLFHTNNNSLPLTISSLKFFSVVSTLLMSGNMMVKLLSDLMTNLFDNFPTIKNLGEDSAVEIFSILLNVCENKTLIPKIFLDILKLLFTNLLPALSDSETCYDGSEEVAARLVLSAASNEPECCQIFFRILQAILINTFNQLFSTVFNSDRQCEKELTQVELFNAIMSLVYSGLDEKQTSSGIIQVILKLLDEAHRIRRLFYLEHFKVYWFEKFAYTILNRIIFNDHSQCIDSLIFTLHTILFENGKTNYFEEVFLPAYLSNNPKLSNSSNLGTRQKELLLNDVIYTKRIMANSELEHRKIDLLNLEEFSQSIQNLASEIHFHVQSN